MIIIYFRGGKYMKRFFSLLLSLLILRGILFAEGKQEERFKWPDPEKTITMVVPFAAGGGTDLIFRALMEEFKKNVPCNVVVSNIGGAGSATGTNEVLRLPADGYTLLASGTHTVAATLQGLTEGMFELEGILGLNWDPFIIASNIKKPWNSFQELVGAAKAKPKSISLGNAVMGGATGVASIGINLAFNNAFNVTPFGGGADLLASVLGGHCDVGIFSQTEVVTNKNMLRPLVVLYEKRSIIPDLSSVPTLPEAGYPNVKVPAGSYRSVSVKRGTPPEIKQILAEGLRKAYESPVYQEYMQKNGLIPAFTQLADTDAYFEELKAMYIPILKEAGLLKRQ
jgi:tripartite-type tricarboxylate transporter receptor subunit TctC